MVKQIDVGLLIFDMDGTIFDSDRSNAEAVKRAISNMGMEISVDEEKIRANLGMPSEQFYKSILPHDKIQLWEKLRARTREQHKNSIAEFGKLFPGVVETLKILRKRGYKLAICSSCSVQYFDTALSNFSIRDYFDYAECTGEHNLTKSRLIGRIKSNFPGLKAAVIGDRNQDIKAARENDALSVGVLYGYGKDEPKEADVQIKRFSELLDIFTESS